MGKIREELSGGGEGWKAEVGWRCMRRPDRTRLCEAEESPDLVRGWYELSRWDIPREVGVGDGEW